MVVKIGPRGFAWRILTIGLSSTGTLFLDLFRPQDRQNSQQSSEDIRYQDPGKRAKKTNFEVSGFLGSKIDTGQSASHPVFWITVSGCPGYLSYLGNGEWGCGSGVLL